MTELRELLARAICCGEAACYNEDCGVDCTASSRWHITVDSIITALKANGLVVVPTTITQEMLDEVFARAAALIRS